MVLAPSARAQLPSTGGQGWYIGNVWVPLPANLRILATGELNDGTNYDYQQWIAGVGVAYKWKQVTRLAHLININADKESLVTAGVGFEYLWTEQDGVETGEDRLVLAITPRYRPFGRWLLEDRNRFEFRWVNGNYETRYRNRLTVERDLLVKNFRFTPYAAAEVFYSFDKNSWDEQQYSAGVQVPYKRIFMVEAYYLYQHTSSDPTSTNVFGLTLNVFLKNRL